MRQSTKTWGLRLALAVSAAMLLVVAAAATAPGQRLLLRIAASVASDSAQRITVGTLQGSLFSSGVIDHITIADAKGPWLEARKIAFSWSPAALFANKLDIENLAVASMHIARRPVHDDQSKAHSRSASARTLPSMALAAKKLSIAQLRLGSDVAGAEMTARAVGQFDFVDVRRGLSGVLQIERTDGPGGAVHAELGFSPVTRILKLAASAREPANGMIAHMLDLPGRPAFAVLVNGEGPIEAWRATWSGEANGQTFAQGVMSVDGVGDDYVVQTEFAGFVQPLLPPRIASLFEGKSQGSAKAVVKSSGDINILAASFASDVALLQATGQLDPETLAGHGELHARVARRDGQAIVLTGASGDAEVRFTELKLEASIADGTAARPVKMTFQSANVTTADAKVARIQASATADVVAARLRKDVRFTDIKITADASGVAAPKNAWVAALGPDVRASLEGHASLSSITATSFAVASDTARVTGRGALDDSGTLTSNLKLASNNLAAFAPLVGASLNGTADVNADVTASLKNDEADVKVAGVITTSSDRSGLFENAVKGQTTIKGRLLRHAAKSFEIDGLRIINSQFDAVADGTLSPDANAISANVQVADVSLLTPSVSGAAAIKLDATGRGQALTTALGFSGDNIKVEGRPVPKLSLVFAGDGTTEAQNGKLTLNADIDGRPLDGTANVGFDLDGNVDVRDAKLAMASALVTGQVQRASVGRASGRANITVADLKDFQTLAGVKLSGRVTGTAQLSPDDTAASNVVLRAQAINVVDVTVEAASVTIKGDGAGGLAFTGDATEGRNKLTVQGIGKAAAKGHEITLTAARLASPDVTVTMPKPARITLVDDRLAIDALSLTAEGGTLSLSGTTSKKNLNLDATFNRVPARLLRVVDPTLELLGDISGQAKVTGLPTSPDVKSKLNWNDANTETFARRGVPSLKVAARANLSNGVCKTDIAATGADGLRLTFNGDIATTAAQSIAGEIRGEVPASIANVFLADRGARATGDVTVRGTVGGTLEKPGVAGQMTLADATFVDPETGINLKAIEGRASFTADALQIDRITAKSALGGTVAASGTVAFANADTVASHLRIQLASLKFDDRQLMSGEADGDVALDGPLSQLAASGLISLKRLDVTVPNQLPKSIAELDVRHVNAPASFTPGISRVAADDGASPRAGGIPLNIRIDAANRIFVKGRGVDAQLGGSLLLRGASTSPVADGGFKMERGRLNLLGRQLDFQRGTITFNGRLDPELDMEATSQADDVLITVRVTGRASKPVFKFTSSPSLPEDEIVARLLFNRALAKLSPFQLAQLAGEIDKIGGLSSGPSTLDQLKGSLGIDVLDVTTDDKGGAAVSAGSYLNDKTYVGVQQGTGSNSNRVVIDHDLTKSIRARGQLGSDGNSKLGIGVEWDY